MSEGYLKLHDDACVVDLHIHPALKLSLFHRNLSDKHKLGLFARASWPFATRTDFPKRDDQNWLKHILVAHNDGVPTVDYSPVTITRWQPEERKY